MVRKLARLAPEPRRDYSLAALRSTMAAWSERARFRWALAQMAKDNPHLIDDIGLTSWQVEEEIAKRFWRR
ncbi:DUF1127 domain-containing protein [Phyllobacterium sp. BT25]|uniref:DUF1127 domain-containing protein n=1 Tax=Phyllobacterium pellucidum TaxID=2740464 RepID=A0A849VQ77_9HYPH|nr:DUF1127 domain-containing protein [Phyllobacterium pellucidum]